MNFYLSKNRKVLSNLILFLWSLTINYLGHNYNLSIIHDFEIIFFKTVKKIITRAEAAVPPAAKNRPRKNRPKNRHPPNLKSKPPILTTCSRVVLHRVPPVKNIVQQFLKKKTYGCSFLKTVLVGWYDKVNDDLRSECTILKKFC